MPNSYYLDRLFDSKRLKEAIETAKEAIETAQGKLKDVDFDSIAVWGVSGMVVFGGALSYAMGKELIVVRKDDHDNHGTLSIEGVATRNYIFVDDLISSGDTQRAVVNALKDSQWHKNMKYLGDYLYNREMWTPVEKS